MGELIATALEPLLKVSELMVIVLVANGLVASTALALAVQRSPRTSVAASARTVVPAASVVAKLVPKPAPASKRAHGRIALFVALLPPVWPVKVGVTLKLVVDPPLIKDVPLALRVTAPKVNVWPLVLLKTLWPNSTVRAPVVSAAAPLTFKVPPDM